VRASIYSADLHYGAGFRLHTASSGSVDHLAELYLRLVDGAHTGVGGVRTNIAYLNGLAQQAVVDEAVVAVSRIDWSRTAAELLSAVAADAHQSAPVRSLIDTALHDLMAKKAGQTLAASLGAPGGQRPSFKSNQTLFWSSFDVFIANATQYVDRGFRKLKVRVGIDAFEEDVRRIAALRDRFGAGVEIAADANGTWSPDTALERLKALARFDLAYFEQPIAAGDWELLSELAHKSPIPIMLDESIAAASDVDRVCSFGGRVFAHLKIVKLGGIAATVAAARRLAAAGVPFMIGQMNEGAICTAAALHVAAATAPAFAELYGADGLIDDPASGISYYDGLVSVAGVSGLGVVFDSEKARLIREF
jgi:L-alanine-DL-glutamate epimerase-like enolase superfamily enzyme